MKIIFSLCTKYLSFFVNFPEHPANDSPRKSLKHNFCAQLPNYSNKLLLSTACFIVLLFSRLCVIYEIIFPRINLELPCVNVFISLPYSTCYAYSSINKISHFCGFFDEFILVKHSFPRPEEP